MAQLEQIRNGLLLEGKIRLRPIQVECENLSNSQVKLVFTMHQGINRQIRRICAQFGWTILKLKRVREHKIALGNLAPGQTRELTPEEIALVFGSS